MPENGPGNLAQRPGPYLIQIDGLPAGYTWKDLKDTIRPKATHSVWTDVSVLVQGRDSLKRGYIKLKLRNEAWVAFQYLSRRKIDGREIYVELWDITEAPPIFIEKSPDPRPRQSSMPTQPRDVQRLAQDNSSWMQVPAQCEYPQPTMIQVTVPAQYQTPHYNSQPVAINMAGQPLSPAQVAQWQQAYQHQYAASRPQPPQPHHQYPQSQYATTATGLPVNLRNGAAITECRTVFINHLNYKAREPDLETLFSRAGTIKTCTIQREPASRKSRGCAQIEYTSTQEAAKAVEAFDEAEFMGMKLRVRFDKNTTALTDPRPDGRPLIVDSSMGRRSK